jgi:phospholipase D1/2
MSSSAFFSSCKPTDVAMNFLQRWNFSLSTGHHLSRARAILPLKYFAYGTPTLPAASVHDRPQAATFPHIHMSREELGPSCKVQLVRSCGTWAGGTAMPERSIYKAYVRMIEESEHFILIENQFFISSIDRASPKNRVLLALFNRISRAIEQQQIFRVMIVIPQVPGGDLNEGSNKFIFKYTYRSINRGGSSLLEKLQTKFPDVDLSGMASTIS